MFPSCAHRDANSSSPSRLILKRAVLYKRTDRATSETIEDAEEMRELLNRGLLRQQDELLKAFKQIIQPNELTHTLEPGAEFRAEIESAQLYFSGLEGGSFAQLTHWTVQMQPESYIVDRISTATELRRRVQASAISLRGWSFPIVGRVHASQWTNFENGTCLSVIAPSTSRSHLLWRQCTADNICLACLPVWWALGSFS